MKRQDKFLRIAYKHTFASEHRMPMAAILVKGNRIISVGINQIKSHPRQQKRINHLGMYYGKNHPHAELDCLIRAPYGEIDGCTMYIVRRKRDMSLGIAKPCELCREILSNYKLRGVYYSIDHPFVKEGGWYESMVLEEKQI